VACSPGSGSGLVGTWVASQVERRFTELLNQIKLRISNSWILDSIVGIELEKTQALNFARLKKVKKCFAFWLAVQKINSIF